MHAATETATPLAGVLACLEQFGRTLAIAGNLTRAGKRVDLTGLDTEMGFICARVLDLPPEEGRGLRPVLVALQAQLEALTDAVARSGAPPPG